MANMAARTLDEIARDYLRAEITLLWAHERERNQHTLLFAVAELCPSEQDPSPPIVSKQRGRQHLMQRGKFGEGSRTLYAARIFTEDVGDALAFYRGAGAGHELVVDGSPIRFDAVRDLVPEPPGETPVLVSEHGVGNYAPVLPRRDVEVRVCSRFAHGRRIRDALDETARDDLSAFGRRVLGVDLVAHCEHLGAVHLSLPNALLRGWQERLVDDGRGVLMEFFERDGRSVCGCTLHLTDFREGGLGFDFTVPISRSRLVVPVPTDPQVLETRLRNNHGELIGYSKHPFLRRVVMSMGLTSGTRKIHTRNARGVQEVHTVHPTSWERSRIGKENASALEPPVELAAMRNERDRARSVARNEFHFFEGGYDSQDRARAVVRRLVGAAQVRCMICDPYLSADDVTDYATFVKTTGMRIELLAASRFLREAAHAGSPTRGEQLDVRLQALQSADPRLTFDCRVLLGSKKTPLHDRFLWLDDDVYVLGSSLNEIGFRATTIYRAPTPQYIIEVLEQWWADQSKSSSLSHWLVNRRAGNEAEDRS